MQREPVNLIVRTRQVATPAFLGAALAILGWMWVLFAAKFWTLNNFAVNTPYWDQWDAEAANLFLPWLSGDLKLSHLVAAHNEHRIFLTRLLALALLALNGLWSPLLEMTVNAALHVLALTAIALLLARAAGRGLGPAMVALAALVGSVPFGWENTLSGFQSQFYFVLLFSWLAMWLLLQPAFGRAWWLGIAAGICAYLSLASGVMALAAAAVTLAIQAVLHRAGLRAWSAVGLLLALFVLGYVTTPRVEAHAALRAANLDQLASAFLTAVAWPLKPGLGGALVRNAPVLVLVLQVLLTRRSAGHPAWLIVAAAVWSALQSGALAFGRASDVMSSRYQDLHAVGLLTNLAALVACIELAVESDWLAGRRGVAWACGALWVVACASMPNEGIGRTQLVKALEDKNAASVRQHANLLAYLKTGDYAAMAKLSWYSIPYPTADRLAEIVASPLVRGILPASLQDGWVPFRIVNAGFVPNGTFPQMPPPPRPAWGSFGPAGDLGVGQIRLDFVPPPARAGATSGTVVFDVAGYPGRGGNGLQVVQGSPVQSYRAADSREAWQPWQVRLAPGPFSIVAVDADARSWLAVTQPVPSGRLDGAIERLLRRWWLFLGAGLALVAASQLFRRA
jgi:hypothetical protein